jgi:hypothetical protein
MRRLLLVALIIGAAFLGTAFVGSVLQNRAQALHASEERANPALAVSPPTPTPETSDY